MHVLITGGAGFVGTNLAARMSSLGAYRLRVYDNESLGRREHLGAIDCEFIHGDLRDRAALDSALDGIDAVVHLAADTRVIESIAAPAHNFEVNVQGTLNLLEAMRARHVRHIVNASTGGAILGEVDPPVHENMTPHPLSPYGASKLAVEGYCSAYAGSYGFKVLSLRFSNVYGPNSFHKGSVVAAFFRRILAGKDLIVYGDGNQIRDFVFVSDVCDGILLGLRQQASGVVQLGSGRPTTIRQLLDEIRRVVAPQVVNVVYESFRPGEIRATYCDIAKARLELGFNPKTSLADGLARTWKWFQDTEQSDSGAPKFVPE